MTALLHFSACMEAVRMGHWYRQVSDCTEHPQKKDISPLKHCCTLLPSCTDIQLPSVLPCLIVADIDACTIHPDPVPPHSLPHAVPLLCPLPHKHVPIGHCVLVLIGDAHTYANPVGKKILKLDAVAASPKHTFEQGRANEPLLLPSKPKERLCRKRFTQSHYPLRCCPA